MLLLKLNFHPLNFFFFPFAIVNILLVDWVKHRIGTSAVPEDSVSGQHWNEAKASRFQAPVNTQLVSFVWLPQCRQ